MKGRFLEHAISILLVTSIFVGLIYYVQRNVAAAKPVADPRLQEYLKLDFIDFWFMSARHLDLQISDMQSWRNYFLRSFRKSPILCDVLKDEKKAYGEEVLSIAHKSGCQINPRRIESLKAVEEYFRPRIKKEGWF